MILFLLQCADESDGRFACARLAESHPWLRPNEVCDSCLRPPNRERREAYTIAWQPGSDVIPDFIFAGAAWEFLVVDRVKDAFETAGLKGYVPWQVTVRGRKGRPHASERPTVASPYAGPVLWDIYVSSFVNIIPEASNVRYKGRCSVCGTPRYSRLLDEEIHYVVDRSSWDGSDFMKPREVKGPVVTQRVVDVIEQYGFTNVKWTHWGEICDRATADMTRMRVVMEPTRELEERPDPFADMPESFASLPVSVEAKHVEFVDDLVSYINTEGEEIEADDLTFIRSAQIEDTQHWIWRFEDYGGELHYAVASRNRKGALFLGYDPAEDMTPEQFMWAMHRGRL